MIGEVNHFAVQNGGRAEVGGNDGGLHFGIRKTAGRKQGQSKKQTGEGEAKQGETDDEAVAIEEKFGNYQFFTHIRIIT